PTCHRIAVGLRAANGRNNSDTTSVANAALRAAGADAEFSMAMHTNTKTADSIAAASATARHSGAPSIGSAGSLGGRRSASGDAGDMTSARAGRTYAAVLIHQR